MTSIRLVCFSVLLSLVAMPVWAQSGLRVRFLGTGAALWSIDTVRERRNSSILVDNAILIDCTSSALSLLPEGAHPKVIFYTHSHYDHYSPATAIDLGVDTVFVGATWVDRARADFVMAAEKVGAKVPVVVPLQVGDSVLNRGVWVTALPGNHATSDLHEQTLIYLLQKTRAGHRTVRLLYATDTGGLMGVAARLAGIDSHTHGTPITALIMEATMGMGAESDEDYRIFCHSSVATVSRTTNMLLRTHRLALAPNQPVFITHIANLLYGYPSQQQLNADLPHPLQAAYDGMEYVFE